MEAMDECGVRFIGMKNGKREKKGDLTEMGIDYTHAHWPFCVLWVCRDRPRRFVW